MPDASDLTTIQSVQAALGNESLPNSAYQTLENLITGVSFFVLNEIGRPIKKQQFTEKRHGNALNKMMLYNFPVVSVSKVSVNDQEIDASDFLFDDRIVYLKNDRSFERGILNVEFVYEAGYQVVPADLERAVIEMVLLRYKERDRIGLNSKSLAGETISFNTKGFSDFSKIIIDNYKDRVVFHDV